MSGDLDPHAVLRSMRIEDARLERVQGAGGTALWRVEIGSERYALRVLPQGEAALTDKEVAVMEAAAAGGVPVPAILDRTVWHDRPAMLLSWCPGRPIAFAAMAAPWRAWRYGALFGAMQARVHTVRAPQAEIEKANAWVERLGGEEGALKARLWQSGLRRDALLHLDYHGLNVMTDGRQITGVLDWTNAGAGDPRMDVARARIIIRLDHGNIGRRRRAPLGVPMAAAALVFEHGWWHGYRSGSGPLGDLSLFNAAAGAFMQADLGRRYTPEELAHVRRWTERWKRRSA